MGQVNVEINNRKYQIACDDGQEEHLAQLGTFVDSRITQLVASVGQIGDARLLVMVSLMIADELSDASAGLVGDQPVDGGAAAMQLAEEQHSLKMDGLASRIESIAESLEQD